MNMLNQNLRKLVRSNISSSTRMLSDWKPASVGVVGLGLMGHGVAQVAAMAGFKVVAVEAKDEFLKTGVKRIEGSLGKVISKNVSKGVYDEIGGKKSYDEIMSRLSFSTKMEDLKNCDLIIEAIAENIDLKLGFYKALGPIVKSDAIFCSNTSSLQITQMAIASGRPKQFVGLHFFNRKFPLTFQFKWKINHTQLITIYSTTTNFSYSCPNHEAR